MRTAGRIVVALVTALFLVSISSHLSWAAQRSGRLDPSFGVRGKVLTDFGGASEGVSALATQSDGKIVAAGSSNSSGTPDFALVRYNSTGRLDRQFGASGKVLTDFGGASDGAGALAIQSDGKIVAAGFSNANGTFDFALARYNLDGSLDTTFNATGTVLTDFSGEGGSDAARALAIQSDGKIVVAGASIVDETNPDFALARYNPDGTLDTTFNATGKVLTDFTTRDDNATALAIQSDGKIVAAGSSFSLAEDNADFALARYNPDGTLDTAFNATGTVLTDFSGERSIDFVFGQALAIQSDGKIVAAGASRAGETTVDFALARYNPDGTLDSTFNTTGKVLTDFSGSGGIHDFGNALAIQSDGKIVVAGSSLTGETQQDFALARYNPDGTLDTTFNATGTVLTDFGRFDAAGALAIQSDGKIVAAGQSSNGGATPPVSDFALARYLP